MTGPLKIFQKFIGFFIVFDIIAICVTQNLQSLIYFNFFNVLLAATSVKKSSKFVILLFSKYRHSYADLISRAYHIRKTLQYS